MTFTIMLAKDCRRQATKTNVPAAFKISGVGINDDI